MSSTLLKYTVAYDDTLPRIAQLQSGDASTWTDIAALNALRAPYISSALPDQLGPVVGQLVLQGGLTSSVDGITFTSGVLAGAVAIAGWDTTLPGYGTSTSLLLPGNVLIFFDTDTAGNTLYDAAQIVAVTPSVGPTGNTLLTITLNAIVSYHSLVGQMNYSIGGLARAHTAGQTVYVYGNPYLLSTAVAQPGDLIMVPIRDDNGASDAISGTDSVDTLGIDIALDKNGQMSAGPSGSLATVAGPDNVIQALRTRLRTVPGELVMHPDFGFQAHFLIGANQEAFWPKLLAALTYECVLADPRIHDVSSLSVTTQADTSLIDLSVTVAQNGQLLNDVIQF